MREKVKQKILEKKAIAIVRGYTPQEVLALAKALYAGGIELLEVTFDQKSAAARETTVETVKLLNKELGDKMCFGTGTVTTVEMVRQTYEAGGKFVISPDMDPEVIRAAGELGLVSIPGAFTPTEIKQAYKNGADFVKVFPVNALGDSYIKAVTAPLSHIPLLAVGGVDGSNIKAYLSAGAVGAGVASCLFKKEWIQKGQWEKITEAAKEFTKLLSEG